MSNQINCSECSDIVTVQDNCYVDKCDECFMKEIETFEKENTMEKELQKAYNFGKEFSQTVDKMTAPIWDRNIVNLTNELSGRGYKLQADLYLSWNKGLREGLVEKEIRNTPDSPENWVTNAYKRDLMELGFYGNDEFKIGKPVPTKRFSVEYLENHNIVGVYKVEGSK